MQKKPQLIHFQQLLWMTGDWEFLGLGSVRILYPYAAFTGWQAESKVNILSLITPQYLHGNRYTPCFVPSNKISSHCLNSYSQNAAWRPVQWRKIKSNKCRNLYSGQRSESSVGLAGTEELFWFTPAEHLMPNITNEVTKPNNAPNLFPYNHSDAPYSCFQLSLWSPC